jgi:hypothetical protein
MPKVLPETNTKPLLSMMHIEQEKLNRKLREVLDQKTVLDKIDATYKC